MLPMRNGRTPMLGARLGFTYAAALMLMMCVGAMLAS
jgi:hypothetical protein